jgi:hypothetical protein
MHGTASDRHPRGANYKYPGSKSHPLFNIDHFHSAHPRKKKGRIGGLRLPETCYLEPK